MYASFTGKSDPKPYEHVTPATDINARNGANAPGADLSLKFDFSKEDQVDDLLLNEVIWQSVRVPIRSCRFPCEPHSSGHGRKRMAAIEFAFAGCDGLAIPLIHRFAYPARFARLE